MYNKVFVIGSTGKRLMPTTPRKARLLLKEGKATVYKKQPFTIQLNYKTGGAVQERSFWRQYICTRHRSYKGISPSCVQIGIFICCKI